MRGRVVGLVARGLSRLRRSEAAASALVVPVPAAERALGRGLLPAAADLPAHITLLYPFEPEGGFTPEVERALREVFAAFDPFAFRLTSIERFPDVAYLAPQPAGPFRAMTEAIAARWRECPPYEGAFDDIVPHLTLAEGDDRGARLDEVAARLPIEARAVEAWLVSPTANGGWERRSRFPLGRLRA